MTHYRLYLIIQLSFLAIPVAAQEVISLYEGKPEGSEHWQWEEAAELDSSGDMQVVYNVTAPTLTAYIPPYYLATGTAVIIAPGGDMHLLRMGIEGKEVAQWLNTKGIAAFVLKYRVSRLYSDDPEAELREKMRDSLSFATDYNKVIPLALKDVLTAIHRIRQDAEKYKINPEKVGLLGFSAGGSLAIAAANQADQSNRPNFVAAIYPGKLALAGDNVPDVKTPLFLSLAGNDESGLAPFSLELYDKWTEAGHPAELHLYEQGGHGFGMKKQNLPTDTWYERLGEWLQLQGYLKKLYPNKYEKLYGQEAVARGRIERVKKMQMDYANLERYKAENAALKRPQKGEQRVVFLGNSITEGWVMKDSGFFATNSFIGRGISGQTSPQLLLRFRQDVIALQPKAVVIHIGTNDVAENTGPYDPNYTMSNVTSMVELAQENDIQVILAAVLPATKFEWNRALGDRSDMIVDLNRRLKIFAEEQDIPFVDYHRRMKNGVNGMDPELAADGVHPTPKGYEVMKDALLPVIRRTISAKE